MKKILLLTAILFCTITTSTAQGKIGPISITHGEKIDDDSKKIVRIAAELDGVIYSLATKGKKYFVKTFDSSDMSELSTKEIVLPTLSKKELTFEDIKEVDGRVYVFGSDFDKKTKESNLFGIEVNKDGTIKKDVIELFSTTVTKKKERGAFYFRSSPQGDKLLILHASLFEKEDLIQYEVKLFNGALEFDMAQLEKVPFKDRRDIEFSIADYEVDENANVFIAINESYRNKKTKTNIEKLEIHSFKPSNDYKKEVVKIDIKNKEIISAGMLVSDGVLNIVGFYASVKKSGKPNKDFKGLYSAVVDINTNEARNVKFNEFDLETKVKLIGERRANKGKDVKPLYTTHTLIEKEDGGIIMLAELRVVVVGKSAGIGPLSVTPYTFITNEVIVSSFDKDGVVEWTNVVPKEQRAAFTQLSLNLFFGGASGNLAVGGGISFPLAVLGKGPEYLSILPIYKDGELTVLFNDTEKNVGNTDIEEVKKMLNYNKALPTAFVYDKDGNMERIDQENAEDKQLILRPGVYLRNSPSDYIIYSSRKSVEKLGRLKIE